MFAFDNDILRFFIRTFQAEIRNLVAELTPHARIEALCYRRERHASYASGNR
jgi:hypothetical protein